MKFTKEQAVQGLTATFKTKEKDLDLGRTISENVDNALKMVGESYEGELADFVKLVEPTVTTAVGLMRHETSIATKTLQDKIKELEDETKDKDKNFDKKTNEPDNKYAELERKFDELKAKIADADKAKKIDEKRKALVDKIAEKVKDSEWINAILAKSTISDELDVDAEAKDYVEMYNKTHAGDDNPPTPNRGTGKSKTTPDLSELDAALKSLRGDFSQNKKEV